eukprot:SRR837773.15915.p2 GENE.SRR837773.15915~~SRR837773.15915.p2  ORF type:complete len:160 (+),score=17.92 SRR837773.15915:388-867(+)
MHTSWLVGRDTPHVQGSTSSRPRRTQRMHRDTNHASRPHHDHTVGEGALCVGHAYSVRDTAVKHGRLWVRLRDPRHSRLFWVPWDRILWGCQHFMAVYFLFRNSADNTQDVFEEKWKEVLKDEFECDGAPDIAGLIDEERKDEPRVIVDQTARSTSSYN